MPYIKVVKKNETIKTGLISKDASGEEKKDGEKQQDEKNASRNNENDVDVDAVCA